MGSSPSHQAHSHRLYRAKDVCSSSQDTLPKESGGEAKQEPFSSSFKKSQPSVDLGALKVIWPSFSSVDEEEFRSTYKISFSLSQTSRRRVLHLLHRQSGARRNGFLFQLDNNQKLSGLRGQVLNDEIAKCPLCSHFLADIVTSNLLPKGCSQRIQEVILTTSKAHPPCIIAISEPVVSWSLFEYTVRKSRGVLWSNNEFDGSKRDPGQPSLHASDLDEFTSVLDAHPSRSAGTDTRVSGLPSVSEDEARRIITSLLKSAKEVHKRGWACGTIHPSEIAIGDTQELPERAKSEGSEAQPKQGESQAPLHEARCKSLRASLSHVEKIAFLARSTPALCFSFGSSRKQWQFRRDRPQQSHYTAPELQGLEEDDSTSASSASATNSRDNDLLLFQKSDMWSIGMIAFELLFGCVPNLSIVTFIGLPSKDAFGLREGAQGAYDFVASLLRPHPRSRLSAQEALQHPWIRRSSSVLSE
uniref:Protein kinase domain-containing protein n=1 Tax=Palpitomonas bilix TaxID=652834 RepID=A0A7S3GDC4_9EUKA|mmetsp:Transcript_44262/g.115000  ORF Transcript_44262/g.115000 Transcript_44262/m.115000 type:complete len:473 (+) Transcript_44262:132-1550(+)